ncbi:plasmodesmata-located protein 2-like [Andrographis paniculata]|uniref:plasmodesmata-located protein 2-like n=1 Tax=Andrographis paniculata TaxID=175694 RepID=UPI0021E7FBD7|nr:plasmodesmata-located protein 2-like [Andrographis paniculata]
MKSWRFLLLPLALFFVSEYGDASDYTDLVFKGCADQKFPNSNGYYERAREILFDSLISRSFSSRFYNTTSGDGATAINGLFQCRGDLTGGDCGKCVEKARSMAPKLCGEAMAARVQLNGCYLRYEISWFRPASEATELLYKVCDSTRGSNTGFQESLDAALGEIPKGVGGGFYEGGYQSVYTLGQCEGDLGSGDCVNCVKAAIEKAKSECAGSVSAQVYLQECYISYTYHPNGASDDQRSLSSSGWGTEKTIAVVLGGLVGVGLVLACLLFTRSVFNKKTYHTSKLGG